MLSVAKRAVANVLLGSSDRAITLQPLSVEGQAGINVSLGVSPPAAGVRTVMP